MSDLTAHQRLVSGPQGPRVVLDGRPVLQLCSSNHLGLADHPRVRQAAADAAMRWGVGAGGARLAAGTMTAHRRLEERLAAFHGAHAAVLFGDEHLAAAGVLAALAGPGGVVLVDKAAGPPLHDGARLSGAEVVAVRHADAEHVAWLLRRLAGRAAVVACEAVGALDGEVAPLAELAEACARRGARLVVDEGQAVGCLGPDGRGALAEAGLEGEADVVLGSLGAALGAQGAYAAARDAATARALLEGAWPLRTSPAPAPPLAAAALAALALLEEQPRRVDKLRRNGDALRDALEREGFVPGGSAAHLVVLPTGDGAAAGALADAALRRGVLVHAIRPPAVPEGEARVRLAVMASHTRSELRDAARALGRAALEAGLRPGAAPRAAGVFDGEVQAA